MKFFNRSIIILGVWLEEHKITTSKTDVWISAFQFTYLWYHNVLFNTSYYVKVRNDALLSWKMNVGGNGKCLGEKCGNAAWRCFFLPLTWAMFECVGSRGVDATEAAVRSRAAKPDRWQHGQQFVSWQFFPTTAIQQVRSCLVGCLDGWRVGSWVVTRFYCKGFLSMVPTKSMSLKYCNAKSM